MAPTKTALGLTGRALLVPRVPSSFAYDVVKVRVRVPLILRVLALDVRAVAGLLGRSARAKSRVQGRGLRRDGLWLDGCRRRSRCLRRGANGGRGRKPTGSRRNGGTGGEHTFGCRVFRRGDPQAVLRLHTDLTRHVVAAVRLSCGQPSGSVGFALLAVGCRADRQEVERIIGKGDSLGGRPCGGALLPCVGEGHYVIDLDLVCATTLEADVGACVRFGRQVAGQHDTTVGAGLQADPGQVAPEDVVPGVAVVAVGIDPALSEEGSRVAL